jgi:beta-galactosidase/beta-glucuronidase
MKGQPSPEIMQNGLEQLREMIARDRNHPCVVSWGVCNEIGGQNPPAYQFAKRCTKRPSVWIPPARDLCVALAVHTPGEGRSGP